jgi:hypothetical protein
LFFLIVIVVAVIVGLGLVLYGKDRRVSTPEMQPSSRQLLIVFVTTTDRSSDRRWVFQSIGQPQKVAAIDTILMKTL